MKFRRILKFSFPWLSSPAHVGSRISDNTESILWIQKDWRIDVTFASRGQCHRPVCYLAIKRWGSIFLDQNSTDIWDRSGSCIQPASRQQLWSTVICCIFQKNGDSLHTIRVLQRSRHSTGKNADRIPIPTQKNKNKIINTWISEKDEELVSRRLQQPVLNVIASLTT